MKRIQRKRSKGMPENCIYVGRPSKWGNPMKVWGDQLYIDASYRRKILTPWVLLDEEPADMLQLYRKIVAGKQFSDNPDLQYWTNKFKENNITELKGKDLACWCSLDQPCHADVLLDILDIDHYTVGSTWLASKTTESNTNAFEKAQYDYHGTGSVYRNRK